MIWRPAIGRAVELRYSKPWRGVAPHGARGIVLAAGRGPGPINALIGLGDGSTTVAPRGNLFTLDSEAENDGQAKG